MTVNVTSPITGAAQTGFTSPTYTVATDTPPSIRAKQWTVSALGGTQAGVTIHSASNPFRITMWLPQSFQAAPRVNPTSGQIGKAPFNVYKFQVAKGAPPVTGQAAQLNIIDCQIKIAAGCDVASPAELRAMCSVAQGALSQIAAGLGDTLVQGTI